MTYVLNNVEKKKLFDNIRKIDIFRHLGLIIPTIECMKMIHSQLTDLSDCRYFTHSKKVFQKLSMIIIIQIGLFRSNKMKSFEEKQNKTNRFPIE